jgi:hypothetical protein
MKLAEFLSMAGITNRGNRLLDVVGSNCHCPVGPSDRPRSAQRRKVWGLTRMNFPYMLGTIFTPDRDKAKLYGYLVHVGIGWLFSLIYVFIFQSLGKAGW